MAWSHQEQQDDHQPVSKRACVDHVAQSEKQQRSGNEMCPTADQRVKDVSSVQLSDRDQVQRRNEYPHPSGKQHRTHEDFLAGTERPVNDFNHPLQYQRIAKQHHFGMLRKLDDLRSLQTKPCHGQSQDESGKRSGNGDIKHRFAISHSRSLDNHRSHRTEWRDWHRDEIRKGRRHTVATTLYVVPHFVRQQDQHQGARIIETIAKQLPPSRVRYADANVDSRQESAETRCEKQKQR